MSFTVTVEIPCGNTCMRANLKPCIFARYTKKWNAYNCAIYHKLLRGEKLPRKCSECMAYCRKKEEAVHEKHDDT